MRVKLAEVLENIPIVYSIQARYGAWPHEIDYILKPDVTKEELQRAVEYLTTLSENSPDPAFKAYCGALIPVLKAAVLVGVDNIPTTRYPDFAIGAAAQFRNDIVCCSEYLLLRAGSDQ